MLKFGVIAFSLTLYILAVIQTTSTQIPCIWNLAMILKLYYLLCGCMMKSSFIIPQNVLKVTVLHLAQSETNLRDWWVTGSVHWVLLTVITCERILSKQWQLIVVLWHHFTPSNINMYFSNNAIVILHESSLTDLVCVCVQLAYVFSFHISLWNR